MEEIQKEIDEMDLKQMKIKNLASSTFEGMIKLNMTHSNYTLFKYELESLINSSKISH